MARLQSRISGAPVDDPNGVVATFLCVVGASGGTAYVNGFPVGAGGYPVPDRSGRVRGDNLRGVSAFDLPPDCLIDDDHARSIAIVTGGLSQAFADGSAGWERWVTASPVMSVVDEPVELIDIDRALKAAMPSLIDVCRKPRTNLITELERVPTPRAKRIPQRAASYLASHPEDWSQPTLTGPRPKRVLTEQVDESVNMFENRLVARLIDKAEGHVGHRILRLKRLELLLKDLFEQEELLTSHWAKKNRLYTLLAPLLGEQYRLQVTQQTIETLTRLRYRLLGLTDSELYREIPRRAQVPLDVPSTNVLVNDRRYRGARDLWFNLSPSGAARGQSPEVLHSQMVARFGAFDLFAFILVLQALDRCGAKPRAPKATVRIGTPLALVHPACGELTLQFDLSDRTIRVFADARELKMIPVYAAMGVLGESERAALLDHIRGGCGRDGRNLVVLHPDSLERANEHAARSAPQTLLEHERESGERLGFSVLSVSPWRVSSLDDVARAVNWFIYSARYAALPPVIPISALMEPWARQQTEWLARTPSGEWRMARPNVPAHCLKPLRDTYIQSQALKRELESIDSKKKGPRRSPDDLRKERQRVAQIKEELVATERAASAGEQTEIAIENGQKAWQSILRCPVCDDEEVALDTRARTFWCKCQSCHSEWGTRWCKTCDGDIPVILPYSTQWMTWLIQGKDPARLAGSDLLAMPVLGEDNRIAYRCHECGKPS